MIGLTVACPSLTFCSSDSSESGLHFFKFPQKTQQEALVYNLIKRQDGKDGFRVTSGTYLCEISTLTISV